MQEAQNNQKPTKFICHGTKTPWLFCALIDHFKGQKQKKTS